MFRTARKAGNDLASNLNTHTFPQVLPQIRVQQKDIFRAHAEKKKLRYIQNRQIHLHNIHGTYLPSISYQFCVCPDDDQQTTPTPATACSPKNTNVSAAIPPDYSAFLEAGGLLNSSSTLPNLLL